MAQAPIVRDYLRENLQFGLDEDGHAALERYFAAAVDVDIVAETQVLRCFGA